MPLPDKVRLSMKVRTPVRVGDILMSFDDNGYFIVPANPTQHKHICIGIATEAIPEGAIIEWDVTQRQGFISGRRVIVGMMGANDGVHIVSR